MKRQDETLRLDLADMAQFPTGHSVMTYSRGGRAHSWLQINREGFWTYLRWRNEEGTAFSPLSTIHMTQTAQPFGGARVWFACPRCGKRVRVLYSRSGWGCGKCVRLIYTSQLEKPEHYALSCAQRIRMDLGGSADVTSDFPPKPPNMHWRTYWGLKETYDSEVGYYCAIMAPGIMGRQTRYTVNGRRVSESEGKAALALALPPQGDTADTLPAPRVSDYALPHIAGDNRPTHKPDRPACIMDNRDETACRAKAKPGFTICYRHLERVAKADAPVL